MNRKLLSIISIFTLIMFIGINVKASYTCEASTCPTCVKDSDAPEGTTCTNKQKCDTNCHSGTPYNCGCKDADNRPSYSFSNGSCSCAAVTGTVSGPSGTVSGNTTQGTISFTACNTNETVTCKVITGGTYATLSGSSGTTINITYHP